MGIAMQIAQGLDRAFREKDFHSRQSMVRVGEDGTYLLEWRDETLSVKGEIFQEDTLGVMLRSLVIEKNVSDAVTAPYLQRVATAIETRVTYLQEPLKLIELEPNSSTVQMRSEKPHVEDGTISYFEVMLKSGAWFGHRTRLSLRRYAQYPDEEKDRRAIAFPLIKAQFERLIDDLVSIL